MVKNSLEEFRSKAHPGGLWVCFLGAEIAQVKGV